MRDRLRDDLTAALKARDRIAVSALRSALGAIANAEAVPVERPPEGVVASEHVAGVATGLGAAEAGRRPLSEADLRSILETEMDERSAAAAEYERLGRDALAAQLRAEADVLRRYLKPCGEP